MQIIKHVICLNNSNKFSELWNYKIENYSINIYEIKIEYEYFIFSTFNDKIIASYKWGEIIINDCLWIKNSKYEEKICKIIKENQFKKWDVF